MNAASVFPLVGIWFTNRAGWDRGIDHAASEDECRKGGDGRTLCGRRLGRSFVYSGDPFNARESFSCKTCAVVARKLAVEEVTSNV